MGSNKPVRVECSSIEFHAAPDHPLIRSGWFLSLPVDLFEACLEIMNERFLDAEMVELDRRVGRYVGDHREDVGLRQGDKISCQFVRGSAPVQKLEDFKKTWAEVDWGCEVKASAEDVHAAMSGPLKAFELDLRGYCGWLVTNSDFIKEQCQLIDDWATDIAKVGYPHPSKPSLPIPPEQCGEYLAALQAFCARWQLEQLAGPNLPVPVSPQYPAVAPEQVSQHLRGSLRYLALPKIVGVPNAEVVRRLLEDASGRHDGDEHLAGWFALISSKNPGKNAIGRYAKLFELQHFWRVLHGRHAAACRRKVAKLESVFAAYLGVESETIHKYMLDLSRLLGRDWYER